MSWKTVAIERTWLQRLLPLLSASFGEEVSLEDELEHFDATQPTGWVAAVEGERALGFVRNFPAGPDHCHLELFVEPGPKRSAIAEALLRAFDQGFLPPRPSVAKLRLRRDEALLEAARRAWSGALEEGFLVFERAAEASLSDPVGAGARRAELADAHAVRQLLSCLVERDLPGIRKRSEAGRVVVLELQGALVGAAEVNLSERTLHLATLVVDADRRGQGHGRQLLEGLLRLFDESHPGVPWATEVREDNHASRALMAACGFQERTARRELWLSKPYPPRAAGGGSGSA